jgi:sialic acid synthase SpsE/mannose-6-phosphate isomerase-like protein (cupin superfamily)
MLFIMEMANNHCGDIKYGKKIIEEFHAITKKFPQFQFAFKFQRRELDTFLHPNYRDAIDIPYIKRFIDAQITVEQLLLLKEYAKALGFLTICTPFDEAAVETVEKLGFDYLKIGSCSINDWSLLNKIAETNMPVIGSVGGLADENIDKVISFFANRQIPLILMYCVGMYPTLDGQLSLDRLDDLQRIFSDVKWGFSTHERPDNYDAIKIAIAKGITIFEKHVDIEHKNAYSITPTEYQKYLEAAVSAINMCNINTDAQLNEKDKLKTLQRGVFVKSAFKAGDILTRDDLFFAFPVVCPNQYTADVCSKYTSFKLTEDVDELGALKSTATIIDNSSIIDSIRKRVKELLDNNNVVYPSPSSMDISHHYGLSNFDKFGMCLITLVNNKYCKKLLILLPGQKNPAHYHKRKNETFFVLAGEAIIEIDGATHVLTKGMLLNIDITKPHSIYTTEGTVIEELSSTHVKNDSFYLDKTIMTNTNRKTTIYV